jgi:hypothetical protein
MRDLYNRANKLKYWLNRINTDLDGSDKADLLDGQQNPTLAQIKPEVLSHKAISRNKSGV